MKDYDVEIERKTTITINIGEDEVRLALKQYATEKLKKLGAHVGTESDVQVAFVATTYGDFDHAAITFTHTDRSDKLP